jgi:hypothetical protein
MRMHLSPFSCVRLHAGAAVVALAPLLLVGSASAASFQIVNGIDFTLQSDFGNFYNGTNTLTGTDGTILQPSDQIKIFYSQSTGSFNSPNVTGSGQNDGLEIINANPNQPVQLTFTFLGFEAGYTNVSEASFSYSNTSAMFTNQSTIPGTQQSVSVPVSGLGPFGLVPFLFNSTAYGNPNSNNSGTAVNGGQIGANVAMGFMLGKTSDVAYAFLKDIWQGGDLDFDDMVVEITVSQQGGQSRLTTPLPAALPLFATGLGAMGLFGWRRKRKNAAALAAA